MAVFRNVTPYSPADILRRYDHLERRSVSTRQAGTTHLKAAIFNYNYSVIYSILNFFAYDEEYNRVKYDGTFKP
jgi:hypothetical protein